MALDNYNIEPVIHLHDTIIYTKSGLSIEEGLMLYQDFVNNVAWNYNQGLIEYVSLHNINLRSEKWKVANDPYLQEHDIYELAKSLLIYNTRWAFVWEQHNNEYTIREGRHRLMALELLMELGIISNKTSLVGFDIHKTQYDFLFTDLFKKHFTTSFTEELIKTVKFLDVDYYVSDKHNAYVSALLYHRLLYANGLLHYVPAINDIFSQDFRFIKLDWLVSIDEALQILEEDKNENRK